MRYILCFVLLSAAAFAQNPFDSSKTVEKKLVADTAKTVSDTTKKKGGDIDSVVYSNGRDSLIFFVQDKKIDIYGKGELKYKETNLKSGKIFVNFETNDVEAYGKPNDTLPSKLDQTPILVDKGEEYKGTRMRYNFKTTRGFITFAATKADEAAYSGAKINKVDKNTFFVENGIYTTCDAPEPHYYFYGSEMKVIQKEQMIGKWVWLAFEGVPFPIPLPWVVVPLQSGRRSGIIPPAYGERAGYGRYFSHIGYFFAINDYMDLNVTSDYYTKSGFGLQSRYRYSSRYNYTGYIQASYSNLTSGESTDPDRTKQKDWMLNLVHNQTLTPTSHLDLNMSFMSSTYYTQNSTNYNDILNTDIRSNASYTKSWEEAGTSLSASYSRTQNLQTGNITEILPSISFSKSQFYPFKSKHSTSDDRWYELLGINYTGQFQNQRNKTDGDLQIRGGIEHNLNTSVSPKIGYFNISPSVGYTERWYNKQIEEYSIPSSTGTDSIVAKDIHKLGFVRTYDLGVSASTKLYGIVQPMTAGVAAIRHILSPSISYNFAPDFSKTQWGYYGTYRKSNGHDTTYNKYEREIFGSPGNYETQSLSFRLDNLFEMKTMVDPRDTTSKESKYQLMNLSGNFSYNFAADSLRFSDIYLSYRTQLGTWLSLSGSSSYSLYNYDSLGRPINKFLLNQNKGLMRLENVNFSISLNLSGEKSTSQNTSGKPQEKENTAPTPPQFADNRYNRGLYQTVDETDFTIPWSMSLNYNYSFSKSNPYSPSKYSNVSGNFNFNLTPSWKFSISGSYDITNKQFAAPQVVVSRDLHCWLMNFTWNPIGSYTGYRFEIRVKAAALQDLKVTKAESFFSGRY